MKRTAWKRKPAKPAPKRPKLASKGYNTPAWFNAIKPGSHGSTPAQKRLWRVVSEHVRQRDFEAYGGKCVSCPTRLSDWRAGDAGHWLPYSVCNGWAKFSLLDCHLQCKGCNMGLMRSGAHIGHAMGEELKRRYGDDVLERIHADNLKNRGVKIQDWEVVELVAALRPDLVIPT